MFEVHESPIMQEMFRRIDAMDKKELREFAKSTLLQWAEAVDKCSAVEQRNRNLSQDYLSRCRSSGGVTLPPNFS